MKNYFVYILANKKNGTLYVGVTNDLERRICEHKNSKDPNSFSAKNLLSLLVYYEQTNSIETALAREKQLKNWKRAWKLTLIEKENPQWDDLSVSFFRHLDPGSSPG